MVSKQDVFMEDAKAETVQYQPGMISSSNHSGLTQSVRVGARVTVHTYVLAYVCTVT